MNAKNRTKATAARHGAELPDRYRAEPMPKALGGGPLASAKAKAANRRRRAETAKQQREIAKQRRRADARRRAKARTLAKTARHYWITPKAHRRRCSHCGTATAIAIRPSDQKASCAGCIDRLGINARESAASRGLAGVTIRHVEPGAPFGAS